MDTLILSLLITHSRLSIYNDNEMTIFILLSDTTTSRSILLFLIFDVNCLSKDLPMISMILFTAL